MESRTIYRLILTLVLMIGFLPSVHAVTDAELEALERQIEQQEAEDKQQAKSEAKRKAEQKRKVEAEAEKKRLAELEKQRQEEQRLLEEEKDKLIQEKRKLEEARQAELERKRQEEEVKRLAEEEQKRKEEDAAKARVTIVFYRNQGYIGGGGTVSISHNGENIGSLKNKTFFIYFSPPSTQNFLTSVQGIDLEKTFEFKPSLTYYISYNFTFEATLEIIPNSDGRVAIKGIKNTGNINPADVLSDYDESEAYKEPITTQQQAPL